MQIRYKVLIDVQLRTSPAEVSFVEFANQIKRVDVQVVDDSSAICSEDIHFHQENTHSRLLHQPPPPSTKQLHSTRTGSRRLPSPAIGQTWPKSSQLLSPSWHPDEVLQMEEGVWA